MPSPNIPQGTLNRLRGSITWASFPSLQITSAFMGRDGMEISFNGDSVQYIDTMTGAVTSPEPYLSVDVAINLLRTQALSNLFKNQLESNSLLGDATFRTDSVTLGTFQLTNTAIKRVRGLRVNGTDPGFVVEIGGYYLINADLFG